MSVYSEMMNGFPKNPFVRNNEAVLSYYQMLNDALMLLIGIKIFRFPVTRMKCSILWSERMATRKNQKDFKPKATSDYMKLDFGATKDHV